MSYLEIKDNVRSSLVSKSWYKAAISIRTIDQPPWLIVFSKSRTSYEFYNPSNFKKHTMEFPETLIGSYVRYSKDGWLLMSKTTSSDFMLFNPFTMDLVVLPDLELGFGYQLVGFSCPPTSSDCVVFAIKDYDPGHVVIRTWSPGETMWTLIQVDSQFLDVKHNNVVFSNGMFYCLNLTNRLAVFDPSLRIWNVLDVPQPKYREFIGVESFYEGNFMVSYKGDIFVICIFGNKDPLVFKLDLTRSIWEKKESLGSLTIFLSLNSCESRTYVDEGMLRNAIYFPKFCSDDNETRWMIYSFDERRCHMREHNSEHSAESIWIEPPENALELV